MKNLFRIKIFCSIFLAFGCVFASDSSRDVVVDLVSREMSFNHYQKLQLNEDFSNKFFDMYIGAVNSSSGGVLTQEDVDVLSKKYRNTCVQDLKNRTHKLFYDSFDLLLSKREKLFSLQTNFLSTPIDLKKEEVFTNTKFEQVKDFLTEENWQNYWGKICHVNIISDMHTELERDNFEKKSSSLEALELKIRNKLLEEIKKGMEEIKKNREKKEKNIFSVYLNSFLQSHDPHCAYRDPIDSSQFQDAIAGQIEGVGIVLGYTPNGPRVSDIIVGGPAWLHGGVKINDIIVKIGQETGPLIETAGKELSEVVSIVRGKRGSKASLVLQRVDGSFHTVSIKRDIVVFESRVCKSALLKKENLSLGYIHLPSFYSSSFSEKNGRGCSADVQKQLIQLKKRNIQGLIFDVRGNTGGVLAEVIEILGFFLFKGPVLQVRTRGNEVTTIQTNPLNTIPIFTEPIIVLVDEVSASASEILAAAIQDYQRGLILGSTKHTHGKGTVQRPIDLSSEARRVYNYRDDIGSLVITTQKFYRITGGATQIEGVKPDILLLKNPKQESGEGKLKNALAWDEIPPISFQIWKNSPQNKLESIKALFEKRIKNNTSPMNLVELQLKQRESLEQKFDFEKIPLSFEKYSDWIKMKQGYFKKLRESEDQLNKQLDRSNFSIDINGGFEQSLRSPEKGEIQVKKWKEQLWMDSELQESIQILYDLVKQTNSGKIFSLSSSFYMNQQTKKYKQLEKSAA